MTAKSNSTSSGLRKLASTLVVNATDPYEAGQISLRNTGALFQAADEIDRLRKALEYYANKAAWRPSTAQTQMLFEYEDTGGGWEIAAQALGEEPPSNSC